MRIERTSRGRAVVVGAWVAAAGVAAVIVGVTAATAFAQAPAQTPTDAFLAYRKALASATSYAELLPLMEAKGRAMIEAIPEKTRAGMFGMLKKFEATYSDVAVTKEAITGETAVLTLSGKDPKGQPATGSVPMTKEASGWKVGTEKWSSAPK